MSLGKIGTLIKEPFTVLDMSNSLVSNIPINDFTIKLYDPTDSEIYDGSNVNIVELSNGHYYASFIPNKVGKWFIVVYHATYFPWGKSNDIQVFNNDFDSISTILSRILGLTQENYYVYDTIYNTSGNMTSSKIRIYEDGAIVGGSTDIIAEYNVSATYTNNKMDTYSVEKV